MQFNCLSQSTFYHTDTIREIRLYFSDPNWDYILDSLYVQGDKERMLATIVIDGNQYDSVGVRYKGNSTFCLPNNNLNHLKVWEHLE